MNSREAAARWFARVRSGAMDQAEQDAFGAWRADEANEREYRQLERIWEAAGGVSEKRLLSFVQERPRRRWRHAGGAVALLLVIVLGLAGYQWQQSQPVFMASLETQRGERRSFKLPDDSTLEANTQTRLRIAYYRDRRAITLEEGEASFAVSPAAARPFIVEAGKGSVRVAGTRFNVRRDGEQVAVTVFSGSVEVTGALDPAAAPVRLGAGQGARIDASGGVGDAHRVDVAAIGAWREGRIVFDDTPLSEVVRELARYRAIRLADPELAGLRVSSTFSLSDTGALLAALPRILPVRVQVLADGSAEIRHP